MAKRRSVKAGRSAAADRSTGTTGRRRAASGASSRGMSSSKRGAELTGKPREQMTGYAAGSRRAGRASSAEGGMMSNVVRAVGRTTAGAARSTMDTAREWAAGAAGAAGSLASRAGETASQVAGKVRDNPWPSLLIGAGATWMAIDAMRGRSEDEPGVRATGRGRSRSRASERSAVGQAVSKVVDAGRAAGEQIEEFVRERPLLAGAATLGVGVAVGMALPSSATENELLGGTRDKLVAKARDAAKSTMNKVRDVAESVERIGPFSGGSSRR